MKILTLPLSDSYFITLFVGRMHEKYSIPNGHVVYGAGYVSTEFQSEKFPCHKMFGKLSERLYEKSAIKIMADAGYNAPYIDFSNRANTFDSALDSFISFLNANGWEYPSKGETWMIVPKISKKLYGKKTMVEFEVGRSDFKYGSVKQDLEVYITPITRTSTKVTFSMYIPDFIYNKCMTDPDVSQRPLNNYIESSEFNKLHAILSNYVSQARKIQSNEDDSIKATKVLLINFNSNEQKTKDQLNFAYTGIVIKTSFNFYIAYRYTEGLSNTKKYYNFERLQSGMGSTERGIAGLINTEAQGAKNFISNPRGIEIPWTQEREDYLYKLENQFRQLSINLNQFLKDLNEEKLTQLMTNNKLLIASPEDAKLN